MCCDAGALDVYQAFQAEVDRLQLHDRVEIRKSGCLDRCEAGVVAMVYQPNRGEFSWLPTKLRVKLRKLLFPNRLLYGNLKPKDVNAIAQILLNYIRDLWFLILELALFMPVAS